MSANMSTEREGGDITYQHMVDNVKILEDSEIQKFYAGTTVLVTGGTGFLGKLLVEKLLRECPDIQKILLLARPKKNKDPNTRLQEQYKDVLYDKLRKMQPNFTQKIELIEGDVGKKGLGLNDVDRNKIIEEVQVIFHGASTVHLGAALKLTVETNIRGTKEMFLLAKLCTKLRAMIYISTAYSNCIRSKVGEVFYDSPLPSDKIIDLVDILDDSLLEKLQPALLGDYPNTYVYSKVHAEDVVRRYTKEMPVAVVRPSMVISTASEPVAGWIDNIYGPAGVTVGAGLGILHCLNADSEVKSDMVPGDYVVNAIIAAAWRTAKEYAGNREDLPPGSEPPIYNVVSSADNPITLKTYMALCESHGMQYPSSRAMWCYMFYLIPNKWLYMFLFFLLHWIPAYIVDGALLLAGKKPMLVKIYTKVSKFSNLVTYFNTQEWEFENENMKNLLNDMCPADREKYHFDFKSLDWNEYMSNYIKGLRVYMLKDPIETVPEGKRKRFIFKCLHYTITFVFFYLLYKLFRFLLLCIL